MRRWRHILGGLSVLALLVAGGCPDADEIEDILDELDDIEIEIEQNVNEIQTVVPTNSDLPDVLINEGDTIIIADDAVFVTDVSDTLIIEELPDITLVGFENFTGLDAYYTYFVDGEFQGIFVFADETLLIEYPCLFDIEIATEEYFDPFTGEFVEGFDVGAVFFNPDDFICGDAFIMTFTAEDIFVDVIPLVP
jgi:hypothetical protein